MRVCTFLTQAVLFTTCATAVLAEEQADTKNQKELFKQYMEKFGPPGPEHKMLEPLAGNWHATVKMWMDPAEKPEVSDGTLQRKPILGGRFLEEEYEGKIVGQPYQGRGVVGFDRAKKKFVTTWTDSMSTAVHLAYGMYDESSKTFTFKSEEDCPITKQRIKMRDTLRIVSADEQQMEMYRQMGDEKEMKTMEIYLTRRK